MRPNETKLHSHLPILQLKRAAGLLLPRNRRMRAFARCRPSRRKRSWCQCPRLTSAAGSAYTCKTPLPSAFSANSKCATTRRAAETPFSRRRFRYREHALSISIRSSAVAGSESMRSIVCRHSNSVIVTPNPQREQYANADHYLAPSAIGQWTVQSISVWRPDARQIAIRVIAVTSCNLRYNGTAGAVD
jgi:hypothetical protein